MTTPLQRIYRLKLLLLGVVLAFLGLLCAIAADWMRSDGVEHLVVALVQALSDVLLTTGAIGIAVDFFTGQEKAEADTERTREVLKELTPDFVDAVMRGFAVEQDDLRRVASPELLDRIATNVLSLRLGDEQFASEIYADVRDQAIRAPERWYDVDVSIRLLGIPKRGPEGPPRFDVLVKWEYTVVPSHPVQRFACFADRVELHDVAAGSPGTIPWLMPTRPGLDANARECFEVLEFRIDGEPQQVRRSARKSGQLYTATIGEEAVRAKKPIRVSYVYKLRADASLHRLYFEVTQPCRDFSMKLDYTDTDIAVMSVTDLIASAVPAQVSEMPEQAEAKIIAIDLPGWLLPRAGFAFVWTLLSETAALSAGSATSRPATRQDAA